MSNTTKKITLELLVAEAVRLEGLIEEAGFNSPDGVQLRDRLQDVYMARTEVILTTRTLEAERRKANG